MSPCRLHTRFDLNFPRTGVASKDPRMKSLSKQHISTLVEPCFTGQEHGQELALGSYHGCALMTDSTTVQCWGTAWYGQLGYNDEIHRSAPGPDLGLVGSIGLSRVLLGTLSQPVSWLDRYVHDFQESALFQSVLSDESRSPSHLEHNRSRCTVEASLLPCHASLGW